MNICPEQEMSLQSSSNILHNFIIDEMKKKEKILEQVLDQTKNIRRSFESFQQKIDQKNAELNMMKQGLSEVREEVILLKSQMKETSEMKNTLLKVKQELMKMKILHKLKQESEREEVESRGLVDWQRKLELQHKQQKLCKVCRREAKQRYKADRSQEW